MTRRRLATTVSVITLLVAPASAQEIRWFSEPKTPAQLSSDLKQLYETLDAAGRLPFQRYIDREGLSVEKILRQERQFFGPSFPREVEAIVCRRNPRLCRATVGGSAAPTYGWTNGPGDTLLIPGLEFTIYTAPQVYDKKRHVSLETIVVDQAKGCLDLSEECLRRIRNLNRLKDDVTAPDYEGPLVVPAFALSLVLPDALAGPERTPPRAPVQQVPSSLKKIERNVILPTPSAPSRLRIQSTAHAGYVAATERLLQRIGAPKTPPDAGGARLAVFDAPVDRTHCYLEKARIHVVGAARTPPDVECGGEDRQPLPSAHGTHIIGLLVAQRDGASLGINPRVIVVAYTAHTGEANFLSKLADMIHDAVENEGVDIGNLSLMVPNPNGGNPAFNRLKTPTDRLWVVAAGNGRARTARDGCGWFPACAGLHLPNVVSVVATDLNEPPALYQESNSGDDFDLAAPGEGIVSTTPGGRLGAMSGTSQATAIVSAAASMLISRDRRMRSEDLRARLMYTTDLYESLEKHARAGRLNIARALALETDIVVLKDGRELRGTLHRSGGTLKFTRRPGGNRDEADLTRLKRLATDDRGRRFIFRDGRDRQLHRLERIGVAGVDPNARWKMDTEGGEETITVSEIRDFTACHLVAASGGGLQCWQR
jgi:hypothetical protein